MELDGDGYKLTMPISPTPTSRHKDRNVLLQKAWRAVSMLMP